MTEEKKKKLVTDMLDVLRDAHAQREVGGAQLDRAIVRKVAMRIMVNLRHTEAQDLSATIEHTHDNIDMLLDGIEGKSHVLSAE